VRSNVHMGDCLELSPTFQAYALPYSAVFNTHFEFSENKVKFEFYNPISNFRTLFNIANEKQAAGVVTCRLLILNNVHEQCCELNTIKCKHAAVKIIVMQYII